jgi:hypothetical protein
LGVDVHIYFNDYNKYRFAHSYDSNNLQIIGNWKFFTDNVDYFIKCDIKIINVESFRPMPEGISCAKEKTGAEQNEEFDK